MNYLYTNRFQRSGTCLCSGHIELSFQSDYRLICGICFPSQKCEIFTSKEINKKNACARVITKTGRRSHITPVLKELHWLPVHRRIQYKILSHTYRAIHHQSPVYLSDLLSVYRPTRSLRSESTILLTVPRTRTVTYGDRIFTKAAATRWNSLPVNIRSSDSCIKFQRQLKTFLSQQQYIDNNSTYQQF